jgi:rRNA maturation RNase YbeY
MSNKIEIFSFNRKFKKFDREIRLVVLEILKILKKDKVSAEIYLIDGKKAKLLNKKFRGKNKTANVLSFKEPRGFIYPPTYDIGGGVYPPPKEKGKKTRKIGEIYIKFPADDYSIDQLLIHGLLHLLGYEHQKKNDRIKMEKKELSVMRALKFYK